MSADNLRIGRAFLLSMFRIAAVGPRRISRPSARMQQRNQNIARNTFAGSRTAKA
jgi:hypothetical protein